VSGDCGHFQIESSPYLPHRLLKTPKLLLCGCNTIPDLTMDGLPNRNQLIIGKVRRFGIPATRFLALPTFATSSSVPVSSPPPLPSSSRPSSWIASISLLISGPSPASSSRRQSPSKHPSIHLRK
jgi:hypothetical protein